MDATVNENQGVTESQFHTVKEFHDSEMKSEVTGQSDVQMRKDEPNNFVQPLQEVSDDRKSIQNSLKRPSSVFQSILSEWPTSPVKMKKTENALAKLSPLYKFNASSLKRTYSKVQRSAVHTNKLPTTSSRFATATGKPISMSSGLNLKKKNIFQDVQVSAHELSKMSNYLDEMDSNGEPKLKTPTMHTSCLTRITYTQEGRESAAAIQLDDDSANIQTPSEQESPGYLRSVSIKRRLLFQDNTVQVSPHIKSLRKVAFAEQLQSIAKKCNVQPVPSILFFYKLLPTKIKWKEFLQHSRPSNVVPIAIELTNQTLNVTCENATTFRFNVRDYYSDQFCRENITGIYLQDDIVVIMDEHCQVGLNEISTAFLSCSSVDPKLVHQKWIENHMKWIVVKLAGMERSFPDRFAGQALTLENLMLQLKYRYHREIDHGERSAIRKISEMDNTPAKRIVLFVAGIKKTGFECEFELCDGWYSLWSTVLPFHFTKFVSNGKIQIGTKLVIHGASVIDLNNGCHPLDRRGKCKLKIDANSTRRAKWDTSLGYCRNAGPYTISLRSVIDNGGIISQLKICILRVYPVVYINSKKHSDVHSERAERRRNIIDERQNFATFDKLYDDISREVEDEENATRCKNSLKKISCADIASITDAALLYDLLKQHMDPEGIETEMTNTQKTMVLDYKDKLHNLRTEEVILRVNRKFASIEEGIKKFVPVFKLRITDETSFDKIAAVSIWNPTDEILSMFKEGTAYELTGSTARGTIFDELQLYAGKKSKFRKITSTNPVPSSLCRRYTSIFEILSSNQVALHELDTIGLVVYVCQILHKTQLVYVADGEQNVMCICFWESLKDVAYDDVVQPKRFLAMSNLQWRKSSNSKPVPCTHVTEYSVLTENPQSSELTNALIKLKTKLADVELDGFIEACMEKVRSDNTSLLSTPIRSYSSSSSLQSSSRLALKNQSPMKLFSNRNK